MEQQEGFDPSTSTLATLRSTWLSYGCNFFENRCPPSEGRDSRQIFKDHPPTPLGGVSSRQCDHCSGVRQQAPFAVVCGAIRTKKNKKARNPFRNPGLW